MRREIPTAAEQLLSVWDFLCIRFWGMFQNRNMECHLDHPIVFFKHLLRQSVLSDSHWFAWALVKGEENGDFWCYTSGATPCCWITASSLQSWDDREALPSDSSSGLLLASSELQHHGNCGYVALCEDIESQCPDGFLWVFCVQLINSLLIRSVWQLLWKTLTCWKWWISVCLLGHNCLVRKSLVFDLLN